MDKKTKIKAITLIMMAMFFGATDVLATPLVYVCTIFDYGNDGVSSTEFQYKSVGQAQFFTSNASKVNIYLDKEGTLHLSIRSLSDLGTYASTTAFDLPKRILLRNTSSKIDRAAMVECEL